MNASTKILVVAICVLLAAVGGLTLYVKVSSDLDSSLSVVTSNSMQHDNSYSQLGVIDTGDAVVLQSVSQAASKGQIQSYVEALQTGYQTFGDYGSVIIYEGGSSKNPIIHRAIIWLDYNGNGTWSAPSLANYKGEWSCTGSSDYMRLSGKLSFTDITQSHKDVSVDLNSFTRNQSGFLTMGDNPTTNRNFDQNSHIITYPIGWDNIRSVAMMEIPWGGIVKLMMSDDYRHNVMEHSFNSLLSLIMLFVTVFSLIWFSDMHIVKKSYMKKLEEESKWDF